MESKARKSTAEIYQAVTKARPELAVQRGAGCLAERLKYDDENGWLWYQSGAWRGERMDAAEALIESKLLRGLPDGCGVDCFDNGEGHRFFCVQDPDGHYGMESDTPLEALAEFYAPGSTQ